MRGIVLLLNISKLRRYCCAMAWGYVLQIVTLAALTVLVALSSGVLVALHNSHKYLP